LSDPTEASPAATTPTLMDASYSGSYGEFYARHWWWRAREHHVMRFVRRYARPGPAAKALDVGCGDGLFWSRLTDFAQVEGVEPDPLLVPAGSPLRDRIEIADFLVGRPRAADHDLVLMLDVLEHIENSGAALRRVASLLGPDGRFVVTVPALRYLWSNFDVLSGHHRRYTKRSLRAELEGAGLQVLTIRHCYTWTVAPLVLRKWFFRAETGEDSHFVKPPIAPLNQFLYLLSRLDHWVSARVPMPFGSSLIAVAAVRDDRPNAAGDGDRDHTKETRNV
jgi:SAM-dependent methyltransferase